MREWLFKLRTSRGMSQAKCGAACGITQAMYGMIERGERNPSVKTAKRISEMFGFPWTKFFENQEG